MRNHSTPMRLIGGLEGNIMIWTLKNAKNRLFGHPPDFWQHLELRSRKCKKKTPKIKIIPTDLFLGGEIVHFGSMGAMPLSGPPDPPVHIVFNEARIFRVSKK